MRIAVVGPRSFGDWDVVCEVMECLVDIYEGAEFVSGNDKGFDAIVAEWCEKNAYHVEVKPCEEIVARCDQLIAFWDGASPEPFRSIREAVKAGKFVQIFSTKGEYN